MRVLVAEDEYIARHLVEKTLGEAGYAVTAVADGFEALRILHAEDAPKLAVLDWNMPGMDGVQVIRAIRSLPTRQPPYIIILTAREDLDSVLTALENGANDYVSKSHDLRELASRVKVGSRVVQLQAELAGRIKDAEQALAEVKRLKGLLPICSYCKKIRNDQNYWEEIELYVSEHTDAGFSHGVCPSCYQKHLGPQLEDYEKHKQP